MGQKVNPYGFRLGVTTDWKSRWFADKEYTDYLIEDWKVRDYLMRQLPHAAISRTGKYIAFQSNMAYAHSGCPANFQFSTNCVDVYLIKIH